MGLSEDACFGREWEAVRVALFRRKRQPALSYDPDTQVPAVRKSICTGEMTAGFIDQATGRFTDLMRLDDQKALEDFKRDTGADEVRIIY